MMILLPSMVIVIFSEPTYRWLRPVETIDVKQEMFFDSLVASIESPAVKDSPPTTISYFDFDPNVASLEDFTSLGIPEKVAKRILQYRNKGGSFAIKSDFAKIFGLDPQLYQALAPHILLPDVAVVESPAKKEIPALAIQYDLNLTDTSSLKSVKGIGPVLSKRILKYRESLGGFISKEQLSEIFGLDSTVFNNLNSFFIAEDFHPTLIKINSVTEKELSKHPYISSRDARAIVTYRMQHGPFQQLNDLMKIKSLKEKDVARFGHYLSFE